MSNQIKPLIMKHYGISPWEINVITSILDTRFKTEDEEIENTYEDKFVSHLEISFPYSFNEEFFKWFDFKEWDRLKGVFKEMKRRRGDGKAIKIELNFSGEPDINFILQSDQSQWFKMEVEKIDFVVELLPYHLDKNKIPENVKSVIYNFDREAARWKIITVFTDEKKFMNSENGWKLIT
ncbi:MAG: hypothetical protein O3C04_00065 [Crenarchaeota archaeon]|nr:hypothetical protein [Thermoproteota archaeon]MDA1124032.1 hypothetical protein [Thermoproteota archaeon]